MSPASPARILVLSDSLQELAPAVELLEQSGHPITYVPALTRWAELDAGARQALAEARAVVMGRVFGIDGAAFDLAPALKVVALHTSGCDNVDLPEATRRGIVVTTVKGVNAEQCAEFAMGLMIATVRKIVIGDQAIRAGLWASRTQSSMDLHGATMGVVGMGQIARAFIVRATAFGMRIVVHTRTPDPDFAARHGITYASLDEVLCTANVVGLFASLDQRSRHMIGEREIGLMKPSAYLLNIARGELVDEAALARALRARRIAGAGIDVFETEPLYASELFELDNVVLTPHQAGLTVGGKTGAAVRAVKNALQVLEGTLPRDAVNPDAWRVAR